MENQTQKVVLEMRTGKCNKKHLDLEMRRVRDKDQNQLLKVWPAPREKCDRGRILEGLCRILDYRDIARRHTGGR